jgi:hypothetical protein
LVGAERGNFLQSLAGRVCFGRFVGFEHRKGES